MTLSTEYKVDRSRFGKGPWDNEPEDRIEWRSEKGTPLLMVRAPLGHWCGYVGVDKSHPFHGIHYNDMHFDCHGGLTYTEECQGPVCHVAKEGESDDVWWIGFDCAHAGDVSPGLSAPPMPYSLTSRRDFSSIHDGTYRDKDYVKEQVEHLCKQIEEAANCEGCGHKLARWNRDGEFGFLCTTMGCEG